MAIHTKDIEDMLTTTYSNIPKGKFIDISQELTEYVVVPYLLTAKGGLLIKKGGVGVEETLMTQDGGYSKWIGEYDEDTVNVIDLLKRMKVDFSLLTDGIAHTKSELEDNRGEERINNVILPRRRAMFMRVAKTMERDFFGVPDATDQLTPWGLKYWLVKNATAGFNGGYPSGFSLIGNINLTEVPHFKNYTDSYTSISKSDLILKMKRAHRRTKFKAPRTDAGFQGDAMPNKRFYLTNEDVLEGVEALCEAQNDNLGNDMAPKGAGAGVWGLRSDGDGNVMFKRNPFVYTEELNDDTSDPVYGLDMSTFHAMTKKGSNMDLGDFRVAPNQSRVYKAVLYHRHQTICTNRRNNFVIAKF
jgi:hypothetical protein